MESEAFKRISNYQAVVDLLGAWPSFEDAEVIELRFERGNTLAATSSGNWENVSPSSCTATIYVPDVRSALDNPAAKHAIIQLRFLDLLTVKLDGFNYQNPMLRLSVSAEHSDSLKTEVLLISWGGAALSCNVELRCCQAEVVSVKGQNPASAGAA